MQYINNRWDPRPLVTLPMLDSVAGAIGRNIHQAHLSNFMACKGQTSCSNEGREDWSVPKESLACLDNSLSSNHTVSMFTRD